ncbi:MAG: alpha/beta hydrolase [Negativicutes bacterium]|nr:alpha/beta hydrolase [Negativicutes bacterium]MDR3592821.1 alpha/beta hydrolase [Negativicutes bacterium]
MPYIEVEKGVHVFVEDLNRHADETIFFIHGWPANHQMFEYQLDQLPHCGVRCVAMDIRGFGKSDKPWDGYCYDRLADDVRCVIDALCLNNITLLGFSVGGAIAARYMARHSGYGVSKLALVSAAVPLFTKRPDYPYSLPVAEVNQLIKQTYADRPKMIADFGDKFFASNLSCEFKNWFNSLGLAASGRATAAVAIALRDEDLRCDIEQINVPTTIFHGIHDKVVAFANAEETHRHIPGSTLIPFHYSGHGLVIDELDKFNYCLTEFLRQA